MSTQWFNLSLAPFRLRPEAAFLYLNGAIARTYDVLASLLSSGQGVAALVGEPGLGKSIMLNALAERAPSLVRIARLREIGITTTQMHSALAEQLQISPHELRDTNLSTAVSNLAARLRTEGGNVGVLVDEADQLSMPVLCELLALTTLQPAPSVVLAGERTLLDMLSLLQKRGMAMRFTGTYMLTPLLGSEIADYVAFRVGVAGGDPRKLFDREAMAIIARLTGGAPQLINILCDHAMNIAETRKLTRVGLAEMRAAAEELKLAGNLQRTGSTTRHLPAAKLTATSAPAVVPKVTDPDRIAEPAAARAARAPAPVPAPSVSDTASTASIARSPPPRDDSPTAQLAVPQLQVKQGDQVIARVVLMPGRLVVGRGDEADVRLNSPYVSRQHCQITTSSEGILVEDLGSTNGLQINGNRLRAHRLSPGDNIELGDHSIVYVETPAPADSHRRG